MGHSKIGGEILPLQFVLLRMPLYFILSGLFFKDYGSILYLIEKKLNKILIPALFFYAIGYFVLTIAEFLHYVKPIDASLFSFINNNCDYNPPIWFLFCLFNINVLFCLIYLLLAGNKYLIGGACIICGAIGYALSINEIRLFLFFDCTLSNMPFFFYGWVLKNTKLLIPYKFDNLLFVFSLIGLSIVFIVFPNLPAFGLWYAKNEFTGNPLLLYVLAIFTVTFTLIILKKIKWLPIFSYIGRYSLIVLGMHFIIILFTKQLDNKIGGLNSFLMTMLISWLIIPLIKEFAPYFCAQKDLIKFKVLRSRENFN